MGFRLVMPLTNVVGVGCSDVLLWQRSRAMRSDLTMSGFKFGKAYDDNFLVALLMWCASSIDNPKVGLNQCFGG